ncbi:MAG: Exonuclease RecJ [candidate division WWE3 bacterium GW2011_GWF2_41_45]|uniref:Single-stranded-DNA-specific exonuclease RecJ n=3 Tax=Katanobacteria TaxID=422282 RepID=A0A1F4W1M7_UNCKA|nr:MAG: Exonuclease RecJ [candidate division WWE3 bacterium GW2011_GWC2_41_23]KKS09920.1 MAG: Exonuclease RecJ [candidate division WWE3 bacterium GW2011_GWF2_41_45]KKS19701.1 MAG: Exonuclease RecJ [candidate division WWE3 bacterium GW2011_GWE1_41_72]KKS29232.1 MAG: Exonuclease RecJ [candidate division WWE3 bacterium GW2011_GWD2_42_11]KKS50470.1 MAG: Exonuclease RecJ [candidate division WWE3 bacterium GW2011_GWE2_42_25]KKS63556.1 MAG: Exonuclease RecJ [candidate division WWE3 bacterium GW2011_G
MKWNIRSEFTEGDDVIASIIKIRGISAEGDFLNPPHLSEAFKLLPQELKDNLRKAVDLVELCIKEKRKILIHGDYDSDGICATSILYNALFKEKKYENTFHFIPNRFDHGYGLSEKSILSFFEKAGLSLNSAEKILVITVDCGITANEEIKTLKDHGHSVIITDHHQKSEILPPADVIVWYDKIVGATLSLLLAKSLGSKDPHMIALAALATVTDLQPLLGFNRSLVKRGLEILNTDPPVGIKKLLQVAGKIATEITTYELGWIIGPRLNSSGRITDASSSLNLLIEEDENIAEKLAIELNTINVQRQDRTVEMYDLAAGIDENNLPKIILSSHADYHEGIIGLVAARLTQKYFRPAIVISLSDGYGKGSVRSVPGVDIISFLRNFGDMFESLGGHPMAAGFTIKKELIPELKEKAEKLADKSIPDELLVPSINVDIKIPIDMVSLELLNRLDTLKPFGLGNEEPVFMSEKVGITDVGRVGRDSQHLLFKFYESGKYHKGIFFNASDKEAAELKFGDKVDIVYTLKKNEYNGNTFVDLFIKDIKRN